MSIVVDALIVGGLQLLGAVFVISFLRFADYMFLLFFRREAGGGAVRLLGKATALLVISVVSSTAFQLAGSGYFS